MKNRTIQKASIILLTIILILTFAACGTKEEPTQPNTTKTNTTTEEQTTEEQTTEGPVTMTVTCKTTTSEGKLLTKCAATYANGQNLVPEITWTEVPGAKAYAVYMLDESANNWLHMMAVTTNTTIKEGEAIQGQYIGPYPPSGNHNYVIYVLALETAPTSLPGDFNATNPGIATLKESLGTILAQASATVTYANGDNNV